MLSSARPAVSSLHGTGAVRGGPLNGMLLLSVILLVVCQYADRAPSVALVLNPLFEADYLATAFFVLLSGFTMARTYGSAVASGEVGPTSLLLKRLIRIWPAHLIVLGLMAAFLAVGGAAVEAAAIAPEASLIQAFGRFGVETLNPVSGTLSALVICYAAFPLGWKLLARAPRIVGVAAAFGLLWGMDALVGLKTSQGLFDLSAQFAVLRILPLFLLGAALARLMEGPATPKGQAVLAGASGFAGFAILQAAGGHAMLSIAALSLVIAAVGSVAAARPSRQVAYFGRLAFALFITHALAGMVWFQAAEGVALGGWVAWAGGLAFAIAFASVFERLVAAPVEAGIRQLRGVLSSVRPATA